MGRLTFQLYLLFMCSWFLHLTSRIKALGAIRLDMALIALIAVLIWVERKKQPEDETRKGGLDKSSKILKALLIAAVLTVPFVEWPGSVLRSGIPNLIKAVVFYYFTFSLVTSTTRLKIFIAFFLACQSFRVLEPVYLHLTAGYWGDQAYMAGSFMDRLAGAPDDVINSNGLAFVIVSVFPFVYYLSSFSLKWARPLLSSSPLLLYALALTGSRSGLIGAVPS